MPPRPVPLLLLPLPCVTAPSIQKRAGAVVCSRAYRSYNLAPHAIPRTGEPAVGRRGMRRGSGVSGRAARIRGPNAGRKVSADNRDLCRCRRVQLSSVPACLSSSLGCRWSAYTPLAAALRRDEVVKRLDLGVEQLEGPLPVDAVSAEGGSLARGHRLEEIRAIGATTLLAVIRVGTAFARCRPAKASRGEIGELTATRHLAPGGYRWIDQKSDGKNDDAQHERSCDSFVTGVSEA